MKIITFTAIKGGVGKTTLTLNYGDWLAKHGKKVLLIDLDHQCNLTTVFKKTRRNNTIAEAFKEDDNAQKVKIDSVGPNLDLIAGFIDLDVLGSYLENNSNKEMMLFMWFKNNSDSLNLTDYDYILIDTQIHTQILVPSLKMLLLSVITFLVPSHPVSMVTMLSLT